MILYSDIFAKRSQKSNFFKNYFWAFIDLWGHRPWCWKFFEITWSLCILIFIMISCRVRDIQSCKVTKAKFAMLPSYLVTDKVSYRGTPFLKNVLSISMRNVPSIWTKKVTSLQFNTHKINFVKTGTWLRIASLYTGCPKNIITLRFSIS